VYFALESVRELLGPPGILGNHVVIRPDDGACVLVAHLQRYSLRVAVGDRVDQGTVVATCGNSGNSTEPHLHVQAMDRPGVWLAQGRPCCSTVASRRATARSWMSCRPAADDARRSAPIDRGP
jgi:murein DD-endopeptidase MepM/ murein hydrolase activator NlpD